MREVWRWGINPEEPAYKRTILISLLGQEDPICVAAWQLTPSLVVWRSITLLLNHMYFRQ